MVGAAGLSGESGGQRARISAEIARDVGDESRPGDRGGMGCCAPRALAGAAVEIGGHARLGDGMPLVVGDGGDGRHPAPDPVLLRPRGGLHGIVRLRRVGAIARGSCVRGWDARVEHQEDGERRERCTDKTGREPAVAGAPSRRAACPPGWSNNVHSLPHRQLRSSRPMHMPSICLRDALATWRRFYAVRPS